MKPTVLLLATYYPAFLDALYEAEPGLSDVPFVAQRERLLTSGFGLGDAYSYGLRPLGCAAQELIVNADPLQACWAKEHDLALSGDLHDRRRQIVAAQIEHIRPDILYVFEWCPLGDAFLAAMRSKVRMVVGQLGSNLRADRTYDAYDLMISSWPPLVDYFRGRGMAAESLRLGFERRVLGGIEGKPPAFDVTFVGGFAPPHPNRPPWLERLLAQGPIDVFGYGMDTLSPDSPIRDHHRGPVWGWRMYEILQRSRITLNLHGHIEIAGTVASHLANNMRLFEATGMGTCLITDQKENLPELFEPGREVVTFADSEDCAKKIRYYLEHEAERAAIAHAGQQRTLRDHTYESRMAQLLPLLTTHFERT